MLRLNKTNGVEKQAMLRTDLVVPKYICMTQVSPRLQSITRGTHSYKSSARVRKPRRRRKDAEANLMHRSGSGHCGIAMPASLDRGE